MSVAANYNARPRGRGKKEGLFTRIFKYLFPVSGDSAFEIIRKMIFLVALGAFIYFGGSVLYDLANETVQQKKVDAYNIKMMGELNIDPDIAAQVEAKVPDILPEFILGYNDNNDLVGHIRIENLAATSDDVKEKYPVNYPVYQADDNEYYLDKAGDLSYSKSGSIFADARNTITADELSANTILYGHNMLDKSFFALVTRYFTGEDKNFGTADDLDFYKNHPVIEFDTLFERSKWKIFSVGFYNTKASYGEIYDYVNKLEFSNKDKFNDFILDIMDRSTIFTDVDIEYGDNILTLSTCYDPWGSNFDTRVVVFARKVRSGESEEVDVNKAVLNRNEYRWDKEAATYGTNWNGRVWDTSMLKSYED